MRGRLGGCLNGRSYTSRRELEQHSFHPVVTLAVPLLAVMLQAMLPRLVPGSLLVDLPLLVTIFFAVSRRSPIAGALTGAMIGLLQDALTSQPLGVNGMAKTVVGYLGASIGLRLDVDALPTRVLLTFVFSLLNGLLLYLVVRRLLDLRSEQLLWWHQVTRAALNTAVGVPLFYLLDRAKRPV